MGEESFPKPERKSTDIGCLFMFLGVVGGMVALFVVGLAEGDIHRLTHGRDYSGRLCGKDEGVADKPFLYYCGAPRGWNGELFPKHLNYRSRTCVDLCPSGYGDEQVACLMPEFVNPLLLNRTVEQNVTYLEVMRVEVTQSVAMQKAYPTEAFMGKYCVPQYDVESTLRSEVMNGPLKEISQFQGAIGSFSHAWPIVVGAAVLAVFLGVGYLYTLKHYAGLLLYLTLWGGTIFIFFMSFFFLYGMFPDPMDELGWYQQASPIFVMSYGWHARLNSVLVGLLVFAIGVCMLFQILHQNIDESIGIIVVACDCIMGQGSGMTFVIQPIFQALLATMLMSILFTGFMVIASVTRIDRDVMAMNGEAVDGSKAHPLEAVEVRDWYWTMALWFYGFGSLWIMATFVAGCQFIISYAVCDWFFVPNDHQKGSGPSALSGPLKQAIANKGKRVDSVRIKGVDKVQGTRAGYIERGPGGKVLVVPLGEKGPDGRDFIRDDGEVTVKKLPCNAVLNGVGNLIFHHLGTIAFGALFNLITSPLRAISEMLKSFMGVNGRSDLRGGGGGNGFDSEDGTIAGLLLAGAGLLTTFLDEMFGRFSKDMYVDIVLRSSSFSEASADAYDFISDAGGAVALLHGSCSMYEIIGVILIMCLCGMMTDAILTKCDVFSNEKSEMFVSDPSIMMVLAVVLSGIIGSAFMSLFAMASDSLLYVFAWARKEHPGKMKDYCPTPLVHILGRELEEAPQLALQPHPRSRMTRFSHAASKYRDTVMATMNTRRGASEERPLLGSSGFPR